MTRIAACSLSKCVHVWGVHTFLRLAERLGHDTRFLGPNLNPGEILREAELHDSEIVAISYRLTPENARKAFEEFSDAVARDATRDRIYVCAGTDPVAEVARQFPVFDVVFDGQTREEDIIAFLAGRDRTADGVKPLEGRNLVERWQARRPRPLLRHHYGQPTVEATLEGIRQIAEAGVLDVICIGSDQDAQENFFHPEDQKPRQAGAGGVPARTREDWQRMHEAAQTGNRPLLRTYCGTRDLIPLAQLYHETIDICSTGIPVFWYNQLDGRGPMSLFDSIEAHLACIAWHAERDIPVEILDPHQWAMRRAHDVVFVVSGYIAASICKKLGVRHHIAQLMFNTPGECGARQDLAKILALLELVRPLEDSTFQILRMPRAGLLSFPPNEAEAKGHLAVSTMLQMAVDPDLINVVGFSEANRAAPSDAVIESCRIVQNVVDSSIERVFPNPKHDPTVQARKAHLVSEARVLIDAIQALPTAGENWLSAANLTAAVGTGLLDTPQFKPGFEALGRVRTALIHGGIECIDPATGSVRTEAERIAELAASSREEAGV